MLKAKPFATSGWEPNVLAALRVVGVTVIVPGGNVRTSRPTPPTPLASRFTSFDIGWIRKTSSQLTSGGWRGSAVGSRAGYFPDPSLACGSVTCPEIAAAVKSQTVGSWNPSGKDSGDGRILGTGVKEINGCRSAISDINVARFIERNAGEATVAALAGIDESHRSQIAGCGY